MAKSRKGSKYELDDYGFGSDLDVPQMDFGLPQSSDDRKPVTATKLGKAFLGGAKDQALSPSFMRKVMKDALPRGYGQAMDLADDSIGSIRDLYNNASKEIKPVIKDMKRFTARVLPSASAVLPRKVSERIKKWSQNIEDDSASLSAEAQREQMLTAQLGDIFGYQAESQAQNRAEDQAIDRVKQGLEQARHRDQFGQLNAIREGIAQQTAYRLNVESKVQRKSLELQFRQFFLAKDLYQETRRHNAFVMEQMIAIKKNTGLPDWQKLTESEKLTQALRQKLFDSVFSRRNNFVRNLAKNAGQMVMGKVTGFASGMRDGLSMGNMMLDSQEAMASMGGPTGGEMGASMAGSFATDLAGASISKRLGMRLAKNRSVVKGGNRLSRWASNMPQIAGDWARSTRGFNGNNGIWDSLIGFTKDLVSQSLGGTDNKMALDNEGNLNSPGVFTRHVQKSITEIIPGFLSRIYQELQIMRTGSADVELLTYDYTSNKFTSKSAANKAAFDKVVGGWSKEGTRNQLDRFLKTIDPQDTLTPEEKKELGLKLLTDNMDNRYGGKDRLTNAATFAGSASAEKYAGLFSKHLENDASEEKQTQLAKDFSDLGLYTQGTRESMQNQANLGMLDFLVEAQLVDPKTGVIDMKKLYSYYYGEEYKPGSGAAGGAVKGGLRMSRRDRRRAQRAERPQSEDISGMQQAQRQEQKPTEFKVPEELLTAIRENNIRQEATSMLQTLERIEERLGSGVPSIQIDADEFAQKLSAQMSERMNRMRSKLRRTGRGLNMSLRQFGRKTNRAAVKGFKKVSGMVNAGLGTSVRNLWSLGKTSAKTGLQAARVTWDKVVGEADVYIKGEVIPRLSAWKLRAGEYKDEVTGKVIKSYKDISGNVVDATGKVVMTYEEAKQAYLKSGWGVKALEGLTSLKKGAFKLLGEVSSGFGWAGKAMFNGVTKLTDMLYEAEDVYLKGKLDDPVLLARVMKAGGYFSKLTGKVIKNAGEIDGPVVDQDGKVQLSMEQLKEGIVNHRGKPLRVGAKKILGGAFDMAGKGLRMLKKGAMAVGKGIAGMFSTVGGWLSNFVLPDGIMFSGGKTIIERLTEIRDLLDQRMPGKKIAGDLDGDGVREGSFQDLMGKRKAEAEKKAEGKDGKDGKEGKGFAAKLAAGLAALRGKKEEKKEEKDDGSMLDDAADAATLWDRAKGVLRKGKGFMKGKWGMLGKAAGVAGTAYGAYSAYDNLKQGNYGAAAVDAGLAAGGAAMTAGGLGAVGTAAGAAGTAALGGLTTAGTAAMTGLGVAGTALASVLTAPVLLGGAAVLGAGLVGYGLYKLATRNSLGQLSKLRYAQYGFDPKDNSYVSKIFAMESLLEKGLVWSDGTPDLDPKKVDAKQVFQALGVDTSNSAHLQKASNWFIGRAKSVFLVNQIALRSAAGEGKKLADVDSLKPEEKKKFLQECSVPASALNFMKTPFADDVVLNMDADKVARLASEIKGEVEAEAKGGNKAAVGATGMQSAAAAAAAVAGSEATKTMGAGANPADSSSGSAAYKLGASAGTLASTVDGLDKPTAMQVAVSQFQGYVRTGSEVDALSALRYKTYGLSEMVQEKVRALDMLEVYMQKGLTFNGDGLATWRGSAEHAVVTLGAGFGVQGLNNSDAYDWMSWFNTRFLPTYLNYATALSKATKKTDLKAAMAAMKPSDAVDIAQAVYGTAGAWKQTASPWPGYAINTEPSSVEANLQALKEAAKKSVLVEQKGTQTPKGAGADNGTGVTDGTRGDRPGVMARAWNSVTETVKDWAGKARDAAGSIGTKLYDATHSDPNVSLAGGRKAGEVTEGAGGVMADLPVPQGEGKYEYFQDLFDKVAKVVGVDSKLLAVMAAIESGFRPGIKAATSSATGLFQFISGTWKTMMRKYGAKFGIPFGTEPTDPRANALLGAAFIKENYQALKGAKADLSDTDLYMAHFLGSGGAKKFFRQDPGSVAANSMSAEARANPSIFYEKDGRPRTIAEVYSVMNAKVRNYGKKFGLEAGGGTLESKAGAGRGSVNPEAVDPNAPAPQPGAAGNPMDKPGGAAAAASGPAIPVADQAPAPVAASASASDTSQPSAAQAAAAAESGTPGTTAAPAMSPRAQELNMQQQAQREDLSKLFGNLNDVGQQSLLVQTDMLKALQSIERLVNARLQNKAASAAEPVAVAAPPARAERSMSKPPVSMAKNMDANW